MTAGNSESVDVPDTPAEAEWPPREWREGSRGLGAKSMYRVIGAITLIMVVLVAVAIWGVKNG